MKPSRSSRLVAALIAVVSLLFAQLGAGIVRVRGHGYATAGLVPCARPCGSYMVALDAGLAALVLLDAGGLFEFAVKLLD